LLHKRQKKVYTFERDQAVVEICRLNPYSKELFENKAIELKAGDVFSEIKRFSDNTFDRIIHDPPTFKYSPELYSEKFYAELYRVLKKHGKMYHYAPLVHKMKGKNFPARIMKHLKSAGFQKVFYNERASGIVAMKF